MTIRESFVYRFLIVASTFLSICFFPFRGQAQSIGTDITSLTTKTTAETSKIFDNVAGDSEFAGKTYRLRFLGLTQSITGFSYSGGTATLEGVTPAKVRILRKPASDKRQLAWYFGSFDPQNVTFTLLSVGPLSEEKLVSGNNILAGYDNVFINQGANISNKPYNGNNSIERVDYLLSTPISASDTTGFVVFERGASTGHDAFGIAAITAVDAKGYPTAYGSLQFFTAGTWGKTPLVMPIPQTYFFNNANKSERDLPINPALTVPAGQTLGGVLIRTNQLLAAGQTIYGYSLFAPDVNCSSAELVNVENACFASNTGVVGGIDIPAVNLGAVKLK